MAAPLWQLIYDQCVSATEFRVSSGNLQIRYASGSWVTVGDVSGLATTTNITAAIAALVASSPAALDTLNELAAALGNDANFATTVVNALALKATLASPTFTGTPAAPTAAAGTNTTQLATTAFANGEVAARKRSFCLVPFASDAAVTVGDGTIAFCVLADMNGLNVTAVTAGVATAGATSGSTDIQIRRKRGAASADVLSTKVTLSVGEYTISDGVINLSNDDLATGDLIFVDVDAINGTAPSGLSVTITAN